MNKIKKKIVKNPMNIWSKYDFVMSGLGKKCKLRAKIKHFRSCIRWSKQRIVRGYYSLNIKRFRINIVKRKSDWKNIEMLARTKLLIC